MIPPFVMVLINKKEEYINLFFEYCYLVAEKALKVAQVELIVATLTKIKSIYYGRISQKLFSY